MDNDPADFGEKQNPLPEAPASATIRVWIDDYSTLITFRDNQVHSLLEKVDTVIGYAQKKGWKPKWTEQGDKEEKKVSQEECTEDHNALKPFQVKKEGKNQGRFFRSCKKCNFFAWV